VVALMWSANPKLVAASPRTRDSLRSPVRRPAQPQGTSCGSESNTVGAGLVDAYAAVRAALSIDCPV
jgi:hypothetical protein